MKNNYPIALALGAAVGCVGVTDTDSIESDLSGAVFTTTADGTRVNENHFAAKTDVYLDGGPGSQAPSGAAALPAGDYLFQVTDPSGKHLLSSDHPSCRTFHVAASGVIDAVYPGTTYVLSGGAWTAAPCAHATGVDSDHDELGAITVQLFPFADTPNPGGVYKVWVTAIADYEGDLAFVPVGLDDAVNEAGATSHGGVKHGFRPSKSKTDTFKVGDEETPPPPPPACGDGHLDAGEACDDGNTVDGDGCSATCTVETPPPPPACGDGHLDAGEACDDGNTVDGDGCSATCTVEHEPCSCCGNGVVEPGEECDDGNTVDGDGCSATCTHECADPLDFPMASTDALP